MSNHTRKTLSELTDDRLTYLYREFKNDKVKLYKLTNGNFSVRDRYSVLYQSPSLRYCMIEFILICQQNELKGSKESSLEMMQRMFGFGNVGGFK